MDEQAERPVRARLSTALRLLVSAALVGWILSRADLGRVAETLRGAEVGPLLVALALIPVGWTCSILRWRLLLRAQGGDASIPYLMRSLLVGVFFNNLLPSTIGGDAVRVWFTERAGVRRGIALAVVFTDRFVGLLALMLFAAVAVVGSGAVLARAPGLLAWVVAGTLVMGAAAWLLFVPSRGIAAVGEALAARLPGPLRKLAGKAAAALGAFRGRPGAPAALAGAFAFSLLLQLAVVANAWVMGAALRLPIPLAAWFLFVPLAIFCQMLPVSINGIGVRESVWVFFLGLYDVAPETALAYAWLDYASLLVQAVLGGFVTAFTAQRPGAAVAPGAPQGLLP
ncbi:MAG TPA: lysylphosphatidylglycerol synthase transmembrane domain-containing protein [Thermoanaerobaculia bacterium]|nr:lysylphosphatidylglycerol synthase transmembrane domain-containing protein [Thermoanaerobaculia bacterium]